MPTWATCKATLSSAGQPPTLETDEWWCVTEHGLTCLVVGATHICNAAELAAEYFDRPDLDEITMHLTDHRGRTYDVSMEAVLTKDWVLGFLPSKQPREDR